MPIISTHCPVLQANVTRLTDFEGAVTRVFCPEYEANGVCRIKAQRSGAGPLSQLLERIAEGTLDHRGYRCDLA